MTTGPVQEKPVKNKILALAHKSLLRCLLAGTILAGVTTAGAACTKKKA